MAKLSTQERDRLPSSAFAVPGKRALPMHNAHHAKLAWDMVDRTQGLSDGERAEARKRIKRRLHELGVDTGDYSKSARALYEAHEELEKHMADEEKSGLAKSLDALRARFGRSGDDLSKGKVKGTNTEPMAGDEGYPNDQGAGKRIAAARSKSTPAKDPEGHYEDLPDAENDTTTYENVEEDELDGNKGKKVTEKSLRGGQAQDEEDFYKALVDGDPTGDVVETINATDALELLTSTTAKSMAQVSNQAAAGYKSLAEQVADLHKSIALVANVLAELAEPLSKSGKYCAPEDMEKSEDRAEEPEEDEERKTGADSEEETAEKSMRAKYAKTISFFETMDAANTPTFLSGSPAGLQKSQSGKDQNTPETLNTPEGKKRVKGIVTGLVKSHKVGPDLLGALDQYAPSDVVARLPLHIRREEGLA